MERHKIINKVIKEINFVGMCKADMSSHLKNDLDMDSLDMVELSMRLEKSFGIQTDAGFESSDCYVSDIVGYVERKLQC